MKKLPLINTAFEHKLPQGAQHNPNCTRCALGEGYTVRCVAPEYDGPRTQTAVPPRVVYVLGDTPLQSEMKLQKPRSFVSPTGQSLRAILRENWSGGIVYDTALRCHAGDYELKVNSKGLLANPELVACAAYTTTGLEKARTKGPVDRILAVGGVAAAQLLGHKVNLRSTFGGYGFLPQESGDSIPVFWVMNPNEFPTRINSFYQKLLREHVAWVARVDLATLHKDPKGLVVNLVETPEDAFEMLAWARRRKWVSYDTEAAGQHHHAKDFGIICLSFSGRDDQGVETTYVVDGPDLYRPGAVRDAVLSILTDHRVGKNGQNIKYDNRIVHFGLGVQVAGPQNDVRLQRKLDDAEALTALDVAAGVVGMGGHKSEHKQALDLATREAGNSARKRAKQLGTTVEALARIATRSLSESGTNLALARTELVADIVAGIEGAGDKKSVSYALTPKRVMWRYNGGDSVSTERLREYFDRKWSAQNERAQAARWVMRDLMMPASMAFERVEARGFKVHRQNVDTFIQYLTNAQHELWSELRGLVPAGFNPDSDKQRRELLFDTMGMEPIRVSATTQQASTADSVLEQLAVDYPGERIIPLLRKWNKIGTMRQNYGDGGSILEPSAAVAGLLQHICPTCGAVHASYNLDVARTGRLSCSDPALHGWASPSRDPEEGPFYGRMCRDEMCARPGRVILQADYKQLEYFIAAMLFDDPVMQAYCKAGVDPHMEAAKTIAHLFTKIPWDLLPKQERKRIRSFAKTIVFAQLYGQGIKALAGRLGCSVKFAKEVAHALFGAFPTLMANIAKLKEKMRREGGVWTYWEGKPARWRPLYEAGYYGNDNYSQGARGEADRAGVNTPVQGTASEYCTASVVALEFGFADSGIDAGVVASVHDSVVVECAIPHMDACAEFMIDVMTGWPSYSPSGVHVPLGVDMEVGLTWGSLKPWEKGKGLAALLG